MVLDAALEHSQSEVHQVAGEIMAAEDSFNRFADWCPTQETCALRGQDVRAVFDRLVQQADQNPISAEGALRPVTGEDIRMGTKGLLRFKEPSFMDLICRGLGCRERYRRRSTVTGPPSRSPQQKCHSTDTTVCSATPAWTMHRRCTHIRRCSSDSSWAAGSRHTCKVPQKPGRPTSASTGLSSPSTHPKRSPSGECQR
jgi:hypothetical protein